MRRQAVLCGHIDLAAALFSQRWQYKSGEADLTVMRVVIEGEEEGEPAAYTCDMYDGHDPSTGTPSMDRATGYTCAAGAKLVLEGAYSAKGINSPELVVDFALPPKIAVSLGILLNELRTTDVTYAFVGKDEG